MTRKTGVVQVREWAWLVPVDKVDLITKKGEVDVDGGSLGGDMQRKDSAGFRTWLFFGVGPHLRVQPQADRPTSTFQTGIALGDLPASTYASFRELSFIQNYSSSSV